MCSVILNVLRFYPSWHSLPLIPIPLSKQTVPGGLAPSVTPRTVRPLTKSLTLLPVPSQSYSGEYSRQVAAVTQSMKSWSSRLTLTLPGCELFWKV